MRRLVPCDRILGLEDPGRGLSTSQALDRLGRHGQNEIAESPPGGWGSLVRETLRDPMLWLLACASLLFLVLGETGESLTLAAALVPLVLMDAWLHRRTQASTQGLASLLATRAVVVRDGVQVELPSIELVPGDLALVAAGEPFPADGIVVAGDNLHAEESALTGEALPVRKTAFALDPVGPDDPRIDSEHWGLAGTRLLTGRAGLRVVFTGAETLYGEIVRSASGGQRERTGLQTAIARLVATLLVAATAACLLLAAVRIHQGHGLVDALLSALSLAIAAMPEEFPVAYSVFLGVGVYRLARRRALVRRAAVVENIGRVSCICSDKTGTLTEGRLRVIGERPVPSESAARLRFLAAIASAPAGGDPLNQAVVDALPAGTALPERIASFPFTENLRREATVVRARAGRLLAVVKGVPESILPATTLSPEDRDAWSRLVDELAAEAIKVIAVAALEVDAPTWNGEAPEAGFAFVGLLLLEDPLRAGVSAAVRSVREAGVRVILVTGDHPATGLAIARRIGLREGEPIVLLGEDLESQLAAGRRVDFDVVARALPSQKLHLVRALQERGEIVAVTGDGVNDVPALHAADVGIAMGERGTRSAQEAAAIVLLDDDFRTIASAILEGRQLFANLERCFAYLLAIHLPFVASAAWIPLFGHPLLYLPVHVVWIELLIHPTALLAFQSSAGVRPRPAGSRRARIGFFGAAGWVAILASGALLALLVTGGYVRALGEGRDVGHARAFAIVSLSAGSAALALALGRSGWRASWTMALATLALAVALVQTPVLSGWLHLKPLHLDDWAGALVGAGLASVPVLVWARRRT